MRHGTTGKEMNSCDFLHGDVCMME